MEAAAAAPRARLAALASAAVLVLLLLVHGAAVSTPAAAGPAAGVRPWVARLQAMHDLSISLSLDGVGGEQQQQQGGGGGFAECWGALMGLSSCSSEILLFFVNGESYIGPECCVAIRGATRFCWPAMLASVGFTAQEADVLRGFCDGEVAAQHQLGTPPPPPVPAPAGRIWRSQVAGRV